MRISLFPNAWIFKKSVTFNFVLFNRLLLFTLSTTAPIMSRRSTPNRRPYNNNFNNSNNSRRTFNRTSDNMITYDERQALADLSKEKAKKTEKIQKKKIEKKIKREPKDNLKN